MTMSMDLFGNTPRSMDGGPLANAGLTLHFHAHVDLHVTVVKHDTGIQRIAGMEIGEPLCSETGELPMTHPANFTRPDPGEQWLMKNHPQFAAYVAKLQRELEAGPSTAQQDEIEDDDEGEPTDEAEAEARRPRWFGRRKTADAAS